MISVAPSVSWLLVSLLGEEELLGLGRYRVVADLEAYDSFFVRVGTDQDTDGILCEAGELCAAEMLGGVEVEISAGEFGKSVDGLDLELNLHNGDAPRNLLIGMGWGLHDSRCLS